MWYKIFLIGWSVLLALFVKALVLAFVHPPESQEVFPNGVLDESAVRRAALGDDKDLTFLVVPSRERALRSNKAYRALVTKQSFVFGRNSLIAPPLNVHRAIENGSTDLGATERVYRDGRLWLDWEIVQEANNGSTSPQEVSKHGNHVHSKAHQKSGS